MIYFRAVDKKSISFDGGIHAFEIKHFDRVVVPAGDALTSFIDAEDIGEITAKVLSEPDKHQNRGYSITGPEAMDYDTAAQILSEELGRKITYANPKPSLAKNYWIEVRGLDKDYAKVMSILYLMTRLGTAKKQLLYSKQSWARSRRPFGSLYEKTKAPGRGEHSFLLAQGC